MERLDVIVIGAGVVGLACAAAIARRGREVVVLERLKAPGQETTSRNSGVIHAGIYYPPGSLKARTCVRGRQLLYERCEALSIPHRKTGKLVVATTAAEARALEELHARGCLNGAGALELWDAAKVAKEAPTLRAVSALFSPESGIVDAHGLVQSLSAEIAEHGGQVALATTVEALTPIRDGWRVTSTTRGEEAFTTEAEWVVNAAGLRADHVDALAGLEVDRLGLRIHLCKGEYFVVGRGAPRPPFPLLYPLPLGGGLGIHLTTDLGGQILAGPDATFVDAPSYDVDPEKAEAFARSISRYLPGFLPHHLRPAYAGVRPKLAGPDEAPRDFVVEECAELGAPRLIHLLGIESPGLTAALAIAERVASWL